MVLNAEQELHKYLGAVQLQLIRLTCQNSELIEALEAANKEIEQLKNPPLQETV